MYVNDTTVCSNCTHARMHQCTQTCIRKEKLSVAAELRNGLLPSSKVNNDNTDTEVVVVLDMYTLYFIVQPLFALTLIDKA